MKGKFIAPQFGPVHFETRFVPFVQNNKDVLHNFVYVVNNGDWYEPISGECKIINVDTCRDNHWSKQLEIVYPERDTSTFIKNFLKFCVGENKYLPLNLIRFGFIDCLNNDILNTVFTAPNVFLTNKDEIIQNYFNSIPLGTFHVPLFYPVPNTTSFSHWIGLVKPFIQKKYPGLILPDDFIAFDGFQFGMNFKNKEQMALFCEMWDYIIYLQYTEDSLMPFTSLPPGYTKYEQFIGYLMRIFEINFEYNVENFINYWDNSTLGMHTSMPHDTWYNCGIRGGWERFGFILDDNILTIQDFVQKNKTSIEKYHTEIHGHLLNYQITDSNVILTHINL